MLFGDLKYNRGENNPNHKLTWEDVKEIRTLYRTGKYSQRALANLFSISQRNINRIVRYFLWNYKE